jgi:hypothetical protein
MHPVLEVADILRRHGEAFRRAHAAQLGRIERRVMPNFLLATTGKRLMGFRMRR